MSRVTVGKHTTSVAVGAALFACAVAAVAAASFAATRLLATSSKGQGKVVVAPASIVAGATGKKLGFMWTATTDGAKAGGEVTLKIPAGWTTPHTGGHAAGRVEIAAKTCDKASVSGVTGSTVTVRMTCANHEMFDLSYGGVTAPAKLGKATFTVKSANGTGKLHGIAKQPAVTVTVAASRLQVVAPAAATSGTAFAITINALDKNGHKVAGFADPVHLTSSDGAATLPATAALSHGTGTFTVTLATAGSQTITATDTAKSSVNGSASVSVSSSAPAPPAPATHFLVSAPSSASAGSTISFTVTALNASNTTATGYAGTVHFTSSDGSATLPGNATLTAGTGTFSATVVSLGSQTISATDTATSSITGTSGGISVSAGAATHLTVSAPNATAGTAFNVTVTAKDQFGNTATGYSGTVHFTSSDGAAVLPTDATLSSGTGTFSATLKTAGSKTLTATDTATSSITGTTGVTVTAAPATHFTVAVPANATAGTAFTFTVTALDQFNNTDTGYAGTVHFTSSDGAATLPANATLTSGVGTFNQTLKTAGGRTLTATDTVHGSITGTSNSITVVAGPTTQFQLASQSTATAGTPFNFSVTAQDQFGNTQSGYAGTVHFTSTDGIATLPADSTLTSGTGTFAVTLKTAGARTITATDTVTSSITGTTVSIGVSPTTATHFTVAAPGTATAGSAFNFTVTAKDQFQNVATGYAGTVQFTSTDGSAVLPVNSTLTNGVGTFAATLKTAGSDTITATDTVTSSIVGTTGGVTVSGAPATHLSVSVPSTATAGTAFNFTVTARDQFNNVDTGYAGTAQFTSTDGGATLPANSTLTNGLGSFSATLTIAGLQTITATDTVTGSITGTSTSINVSAAPATQISFSTPDSETAGDAFDFTITAEDQFGNTDTAYGGTLHFTSTDGMATLPADSTLSSGVGTFSATLKTAGNKQITATDTVHSAITGTSDLVDISPNVTTHFAMRRDDDTEQAGVDNDIDIDAEDAYGNLTPGYSGIVHWTTSDPSPLILPPDAGLTDGIGDVEATLTTPGSQTVTATDTVNSSITGTTPAYTVIPGTAKHITVSAPATATAGGAFDFTVTAFDNFGNVATGYAGTVTFTSSDGGDSTALPANSMLTNGIGTFSATLTTAGNETITATDSVVSSIKGTSGSITVSAASATQLVVTAPATATSGDSFDFTVTAEDPYGNVDTGYGGTVHFASSDGGATLPIDSDLIDGTGTFAATLVASGDQTIRGTDTVHGSITGLSGPIDVSP